MIDVEARLKTWLAEKTSEITCTEVPYNRPARFISIERTGGGQENILADKASIAIQCWAASRADAAALAVSVCEVLPSFAYEPNIHKVEIQSCYNFPDSQKRNRYQIVALITNI